jgi:putative transposase
LPDNDTDFSGRWREIKKYVTKRLSGQRNQRGEGMVWQRRFWEHLIRDEEDWRRHMDYVHYNPVKHGYVTSPAQWCWSSFHQAVQQGMYVVA